jgi:hypothetical protein|tara:strand:+ start:566 stop:832 length:267 start_codon:yes stop_codon:yes gene_type:complete
MRDGRNLQTWPDFERAHGISPDKLIGKTVRTGAGGWHLFKVVRLHRDSVYHVRAVRVRADGTGCNKTVTTLALKSIRHVFRPLRRSDD